MKHYIHCLPKLAFLQRELILTVAATDLSTSCLQSGVISPQHSSFSTGFQYTVTVPASNLLLLVFNIVHFSSENSKCFFLQFQ